MQRITLCSLCGDEIHSGTFVSRRDYKTKICSLCAAFEDLYEQELWQSALQKRTQLKSPPN
jgi:ribosome-binding protein aMBF1 (putative translation factor)